MIESCSAVTSHYCFKCVQVVSFVLTSQRQAWTSKPKVYIRSFNGAEAKILRQKTQKKQQFLKEFAKSFWYGCKNNIVISVGVLRQIIQYNKDAAGSPNNY